MRTTYVQTGSQTGRLSSTDPNLQNIPDPHRGEPPHPLRLRGRARATRRCSPRTTRRSRCGSWRTCPRIPGLIEAFNSGEDLHRFVGARVFGVAAEDVTPAMRTKVKAMSYGLVYGLSAFGLSKQLRIEQTEAKQLMMEYFARFGAVRDYLRSSVEQARIDGYTETIFGRRRPFPDLASPNRVLRENAERAALNAPIQGSAADIMKIALFRIHDDFAGAASCAPACCMQIHDELVDRDRTGGVGCRRADRPRADGRRRRAVGAARRADRPRRRLERRRRTDRVLARVRGRLPRLEGMTDATRTPTQIDTIADAWVDTLAELDPDARDLHRPLRVQRPLRRLQPAGHGAPRRRGAQDPRRARRRRRPPTTSTPSRSWTSRASLGSRLELHDAKWHLRDLNVIASPAQDIRSVLDLMPTATADDWSVDRDAA